MPSELPPSNQKLTALRQLLEGVSQQTAWDYFKRGGWAGDQLYALIEDLAAQEKSGEVPLTGCAVERPTPDWKAEAEMLRSQLEQARIEPFPAPVTTFDGERIAGVLCKNCCKPFLQHIVLDEYGRKNVCPPASAPPPCVEHDWQDEKEFVSCKRCGTTMAKRDLSKPTRYPAQKGTWTLTAPDGRTWTGESPLAAVGAEQQQRIPPSLALERLYRALNDEEPPASEQSMLHRVAAIATDTSYAAEDRIEKIQQLLAGVNSGEVPEPLRSVSRVIVSGAICPHGMPLAENICGPCSQGRPNRPKVAPAEVDYFFNPDGDGDLRDD
jgi:hypothetical protein